MADNYITDAGAGGNTYRSDDITGVHWPYVKLAWGSDGTGTICDTANPIPVDVVTLPAANLGQRAMAASLSIVPASDIADATYIGDVKFGEELPAGTQLVGKVGIDQTTPGTTNAVAPISGQAGIAGGTGVDGVTVPRVTLATDVGLPAGAAEVGFVGAAGQSDYAYDGATKCTIKRFHTVTSTSDTSIITAVAGKKFRILSLTILGLSATVTNVHLETKTTNTDCFGDSTNPIPISVDADGDNIPGVALNWNPGGWFETADANEDMAVILSAAQPVLICGNYIEVA